TQITDQAPAVDSTKPKDSIELRYLDGAKPARDRKRPSDLFFGDAGTSQTESTKHKASRAAMPNPILDRTRTSSHNEHSTETKVESGDANILKNSLVDNIVRNPRQPCDEFDEESMIELVASISEVGVLQPVVVRATETPNKYALIMGERRWRASKRAGLDTIPAITR